MFNAISQHNWNAFNGAIAFNNGDAPLFAEGRDVNGAEWCSVISGEAMQVFIGDTCYSLDLHAPTTQGARAWGSMFITMLTNMGTAESACQHLGFQQIC